MLNGSFKWKIHQTNPDSYILTNTERFLTNTKNQFSFQLDLGVSRGAHVWDDFLHLDHPRQGVLQLPVRGRPYS